MRSAWLIVSAILLAASPCFAEEPGDDQQACDEAYGDGDGNDILDLLDPGAPAEQRSRVLKGYERASAIPGCTSYIRTLAQLYRHGPELPGNLVQRDVARASELLLSSAEAGNLDAYASLAEIALHEGDARGAMKWTQVYLYFVKNVEKSFLDRKNLDFYSAAYNGDLLARAEHAWRSERPKLSRSLIAADLSDYVGQRKHVATTIATKLADVYRAGAGESDNGPKVKSLGACTPKIPRGVKAASVVYIVEVLPSGTIGRVLPESFSPGPELLEALAPCVRAYGFESFTGEQAKILRIPVTFGGARGSRAPSFAL